MEKWLTRIAVIVGTVGIILMIWMFRTPIFLEGEWGWIFSAVPFLLIVVWGLWKWAYSEGVFASESSKVSGNDNAKVLVNKPVKVVKSNKSAVVKKPVSKKPVVGEPVEVIEPGKKSVGSVN